MSFVNKYAKTKEEPKNNILEFAKLADERSVINKDTINGTIGMYRDDDMNFFTFNTVKEVMEKINYQNMLEYTNSVGTKGFLEGVKKWVFYGILNDISKSFDINVVATAGGSGALALTFKNYLEEKEKVLLPDYMWTNYIQMAYEAKLDYDTYNLFHNNFNVSSLLNKVNELLKKQNKVIIVINDPCHNPTGYSMNEKEYDLLIEGLNEIASENKNIILLLDLAYIDYDKRGIFRTRQNLLKLSNLNKNILPLLCFSGSKTLGLYGLRIGACICLAKEKEDSVEFLNAFKYSTRAIYSMTSTYGMRIIEKVFSDEYINKFYNEIDNVKKTFEIRCQILKNELDKYNITYLPYESGFFLTLVLEDAKKVHENLVKKDVFLVLVDDRTIRIALSYITKEQAKKLGSLIYSALNQE